MSWVVNPPWPLENDLQASFNVDVFLKGIQGQGHRVYWEKASECPCRASGDSDHASPDCPVCFGGRYEYHSGLETWAVVTALSNEPDILKALGPWTVGRAHITMRHENLVGHRDRFTLTESYRVAQALLKRSASGVVDRLRHPAVARTLAVNADGDTETRAVEHLRTINPATGLAKLTELVEGTDFVIDEDGNLDWSLGVGLGTAPAAGVQYAIRYFTRPRYIVTSLPFVWRQSRQAVDVPDQTNRPVAELPCKALAMLDNDGLLVTEE